MVNGVSSVSFAARVADEIVDEQFKPQDLRAGSREKLELPSFYGTPPPCSRESVPVGTNSAPAGACGSRAAGLGSG